MEVSEEIIEAAPSTKSKLIELLPGALITIAVTLFFLLLFWNRFAGLRSGNGSFQGGMALVRGYFPYRDFYTAGPPLDAVIASTLLGAFGQKLIVIRAWGVLEHAGMALVLYLWLARFFAPRYAALSAIVAIVVSTGDPSNSVVSYGFTAVSFFLLSGWFITFASEPGRSSVWLAAWSTAAGLCAALSLGTKQTLGAGATVGIPFLAFLLIWQLRGLSRAFGSLFGFAAGWLVGIGVMLFWIAQHGALQGFLQDVFQKGPAAKASHPSDFVVRATHAIWGIHWGFAVALIALALCWSALRRAAFAEDRSTRSQEWLGVALLSVTPIVTGIAISYAGKWPLQDFARFTIEFAFLGTMLILAYYGWRLLHGNISERELQIGFLAAISFGIALMISLSWPVLFDMTFPALGVVFAAVLAGAPSQRVRAAAYVLSALVLFAITCEKLNRPQGFHEWSDPPVRLANVRSSLPQLQGMLLPASSVNFIDGTVHTIETHSRPDQKIFVYPEFGILYTLANRGYPTETDSHNIDVVTDDFARSEAQKLIEHPPAVLIYYRIPAWSLNADEKLWRNGKRSGQRDLIATVERLAASYHLVSSYRLPPNESPVLVYVRQ